jgi:hypothetical protein
MLSSESDSWYRLLPRKYKSSVHHKHGRKKVPSKAKQFRTEQASDALNREGAGPSHPGGRTDFETLEHKFAPGTWEKKSSSYGSPPFEFTGPEPGCTHPYGRLPSIMGLFDKFWSLKLQRRIVRDTNRYASEVPNDGGGQTRGGLEWTPLSVDEFWAYIAISLLMGLKKLLSCRLYWSRDEAVYRCPLTSQYMIWDRYELITRCLHVANANLMCRTDLAPLMTNYTRSTG